MQTKTNQLGVTDEKIWQVWEWCSNSYLRHNKKLAFPKKTDPQKTYQWRYLKALTSKIDEWAIDDDTAQKIIDEAVNYSHRRGLLAKGLAALLQGNILQVCLDSIKTAERNTDQICASLSETERWIAERVGDRNRLETLLCQPTGVLHNITLWYQATKITPLYLSLSKSCGKALAKLDDDERSLLPKSTALYLIRIRFLAEQDIKVIKAIFGDDWREIC